MFRKLIFFLFLFVSSFCFCENDTNHDISEVENRPDIGLNSLDIPIFHQGNPLKGLRTFTIISQYSDQSEINRKIRQVIEKELGSLGAIIELKAEDTTGFTSNGLLNIQIGNVSKWDGGQLPISRVSINLETPVLITKSNVKSMPKIWAINDFIDAPLDKKSEDKTLGAVQKLLKEFVENYKFANSGAMEKPTFYIY